VRSVRSRWGRKSGTWAILVVLAVLVGVAALAMLLASRKTNSIADDLLSPDRNVREKACLAIYEGEERSPELVPALARSWKQYDAGPCEVPPPQAFAMIALGRDAVPYLIELLRSSDVRPIAVFVLVQLGPRAKEALPDLLKLCSSDDTGLRVAAVQIIGAIGEEAASAVPLITRFLDSKEEELREAAAGALGGIGPSAGQASKKLARLAIEDRVMVSLTAMTALAEIGEAAKPAIPVLMDALKHKDPEVRENALQAFARLGNMGEPAVPLTLELMEDPNEDVRWRAAEALGNSGVETETVVRALAKALRDPGEERKVRAAAAVALARMRRPPLEALPELTLAMQTYDPIEATKYSSQIEARRWAAAAVGYIGPRAREAIPVLVRLLDDKSAYVRVNAAEALGMMGKSAETAIPELEARMKNDWTKKYYEEAIEIIGNAARTNED